MKFSKLTAVALLVAAPLLAQQKPAANAAAQPAKQDEGQKIVAVVNGETITKAKLDTLYENLGAQMRAQYDQTGGKRALLDVYIAKRLLLQEAIKTGFDKRPDVLLDIEAAKESALFDRYIRDAVAAPQYVPDSLVRKYYDEHQEQFSRPEQTHVRHIVITAMDNGPRRKTPGEARELITSVFGELRQFAPRPGATSNEIQVFANRFAEAARKYSEDGVAQDGGDLGWVSKDIDFDATFKEALFNIPRGLMSGVVETKFGYHLIFVEDKRPAGVESFEASSSSIREFLLTQAMMSNAAEVMGTVNKLTNELRMNSKVAVYPENLR
jgi:parvulin-like peptidyl-prolyl isomerase